jgi:Protein of unknown function (DUF2905)
MQVAGKMLVLFGGILAAIGLLLMFSDRIPFLGKLPGDITIRKDNIQVFFPITTSIVLSVLISLVLWVISHWRGK